MKPDPAASLLLDMAAKDLVAIRKMADDAQFPDEVFGFHAQQATEKAAKAMVAANGGLYPRSHQIEPLFQILRDAGTRVSEEFDSLIDLTDFAVQYRYQAFDGADVSFDRRVIVSLVEKFLQLAESHLRSVQD